jgi:hypothetical protein
MVRAQSVSLDFTLQYNCVLPENEHIARRGSHGARCEIAPVCVTTPEIGGRERGCHENRAAQRYLIRLAEGEARWVALLHSTRMSSYSMS